MNTETALKPLLDPVCGMTVNAESAVHAERGGETFYFCGKHCLGKFLASPEVGKASTVPNLPKAASSAAIYTCPMHPDVEQDHPGACPKCGMALEPKAGSMAPAAEDNAELGDMSLRFWIGAALTLPVFIMAMAHLVPALGHDAWINGDSSRWI